MLIESDPMDQSTGLSTENSRSNDSDLYGHPVTRPKDASHGRAAAHGGGSPLGSPFTQPYDGSD